MPNYWFDHIHLRNVDPLKTAEFYEQMFNAKRISACNEGGGRASAKLDLKGVTILINQAGEGSPTAFNTPCSQTKTVGLACPSFSFGPMLFIVTAPAPPSEATLKRSSAH